MRGNSTDPPDVVEHLSEVRPVLEDIPPPIHHHPSTHHPPPVHHPDSTSATPAQVPSNNADGGNFAQSCARLNWTSDDASNIRPPYDQTTFDGFPAPSQIEATTTLLGQLRRPLYLLRPSRLRKPAASCQVLDRSPTWHVACSKTSQRQALFFNSRAAALDGAATNHVDESSVGERENSLKTS